MAGKLGQRQCMLKMLEVECLGCDKVRWEGWDFVGAPGLCQHRVVSFGNHWVIPTGSIWKTICHWTTTVTASQHILLAAKQANKSRDDLLRQGIATLFRKPADREDGELATVNSCPKQSPYLSPGFFYTKRRGSKVKHFLISIGLRPPASGADVLISSFLQSFTGWPGQDVSCEVNKDNFSLMIITWEAGFPEMGYYVYFNIPLMINL